MVTQIQSGETKWRPINFWRKRELPKATLALLPCNLTDFQIKSLGKDVLVVFVKSNKERRKDSRHPAIGRCRWGWAEDDWPNKRGQTGSVRPYVVSAPRQINQEVVTEVKMGQAEYISFTGRSSQHHEKDNNSNVRRKRRWKGGKRRMRRRWGVMRERGGFIGLARFLSLIIQ